MNNINWGKVPDELTMEQFYKLCHVGKKTARYLLRSGKIPCKYTGKRTHSYTIRKEDVIAFLKDREQFPEAYKAPPGWYSGGYDPRSHHDIPPIVLKDMHVYYEELLAKQPDVMTAKDVEALTGYAVSSVNNWVRRGYLKAFRKGSIYLIPKLYLVEFFCSVPFRTITRKTPWHVQTLKNFPGWDQCRALLSEEGGAE